MRELRRLSDHDFEELVRDLLSHELKVRLESFARGRDKGIDLRYLAPRFGNTSGPDSFIVQCKHYVNTGYSGLKSSLKHRELPKLVKLSPTRLIIATSVDLTPDNKTELRTILTPYVLSEADVLGASDVEALLNDHPKVEQAHYKLWLTSSAVLDKVLHSKIYQQTTHVLRNLESNAIRYVQNDSYPRARSILRESHVCIVAGRAGIGKTTLAQMLLLEYIADGYEPVVVSEDVSEANSRWNADPGVGQIFYYDDFLGQAATADKLNKNEDDRLQLLISRVSETKNKKLLLTTREYILEQARQSYEKLNRIPFQRHQHIIRLEDYTRINRAQILYNHLYFSELDPAARIAIVKSKTYMQIIGHQNYNPRLIDDISKRAVADRISADGFPKYFLAVLDDPETLWQHTFDQALSPEARIVLLILASLPTSTTLEALRTTYESAQSSFSSSRFLYALKEVDGDFLKTIKYKNLTVVAFLNPSVRDFVLRRLRESQELIKTLITRSIYFEHIIALSAQIPEMATPTTIAPHLMRTYESGGCVVVAHQMSGDLATSIWFREATPTRESRLLTILGLDAPIDWDWVTATAHGLSSQWKSGIFRNKADVIPLLRQLVDMRTDLAWEVADAAAAGLHDSAMEDLDDATFIRDFYVEFDKIVTNEHWQAAAASFEALIESEVDNLLEMTDVDDISNHFAQVKDMASEFGCPVPEAIGARVQDRIIELEDEYNGTPDWDDDDRSDSYSVARPDDDSQIHDLFEKLEEN